jgi:phospholipase C
MSFARYLIGACGLWAALAQAQDWNRGSDRDSDRSPFRHVIVVFQENRTPDNLFHELLTWPGVNPARYDIASWALDSKGELLPLEPTSLGVPYDLSHAHSAFVAMYDNGQMDGADKIACTGTCTTAHPQFKYVSNASHEIDPYLWLAANFGWANAMFQTNQGPSYPAHQFIFGGTSAPSVEDDRGGIYVAENPGAPAGSNYAAGNDTGCLAPLGEWNWLLGVNPTGETRLTNEPLGAFCYSRPTMATLLDFRHLSWKYYAPGQTNPGGSNPGGSIWTAPNSIREICRPNSDYTECVGREWANKVDLTPAHVLTDIAACQLSNVSWVIPDGRNSDHAGSTATTGGPSWVAAIVNAVGAASQCDRKGYWADTAILITWDDWGGWYDHVVPPAVGGLPTQQLGFRVPLLVVSAYTPRGYVNNTPHDFGSLLRFIEGTFDIPEGALGMADERATTDLHGYFDFGQDPRKFKMVGAPLSARHFILDRRPPLPPDTD